MGEPNSQGQQRVTEAAGYLQNTDTGVIRCAMQFADCKAVGLMRALLLDTPFPIRLYTWAHTLQDSEVPA